MALVSRTAAGASCGRKSDGWGARIRFNPFLFLEGFDFLLLRTWRIASPGFNPFSFQKDSSGLAVDAGVDEEQVSISSFLERIGSALQTSLFQPIPSF
jgi:hypothetical protein